MYPQQDNVIGLSYGAGNILPINFLEGYDRDDYSVESYTLRDSDNIGISIDKIEGVRKFFKIKRLTKVGNFTLTVNLKSKSTLPAKTFSIPVKIVNNIFKIDSKGTLTLLKATKGGYKTLIPQQIDGVIVTSIGERAFINCHSLTRITIPNSVTSIGRYAFFGCRRLTEIRVPKAKVSAWSGILKYGNNATIIGY